MTPSKLPSVLEKKRRFLFLYLFRDFDHDTIDAGFEFTTLSPTAKKVACRASTLNVKGLRRDCFVINSSNRKIVNMKGRYVCYWVNGRKRERIYNRDYNRQNPGRYLHVSRNAISSMTYDRHGLEKSAENFVIHPRRYHEKFIRIFSF